MTGECCYDLTTKVKKWILAVLASYTSFVGGVNIKSIYLYSTCPFSSFIFWLLSLPCVKICSHARLCSSIQLPGKHIWSRDKWASSEVERDGSNRCWNSMPFSKLPFYMDRVCVFFFCYSVTLFMSICRLSTIVLFV